MKKLFIVLFMLIIPVFFIQNARAASMHDVHLVYILDDENEIPVYFQVEHFSTFQNSGLPLEDTDYVFQFWRVNNQIQLFEEDHIFTISESITLEAYYTIDRFELNPDDGYYYYNHELDLLSLRTDKGYTDIPSKHELEVYNYEADVWVSTNFHIIRFSASFYSSVYTIGYAGVINPPNSERISELPNGGNITLGFDQSKYTPKIRYGKFEIPEENELSQISDLPTTTGNPMVESGRYGIVNFSKTDDGVYFKVSYLGNEKFIKSYFADDHFLNHVQSANYYTYQGQRYMMFFYGDGNPYLLEADVQHWNNFSVWNMTTNEMITTNKLWVLTYVVVNTEYNPLSDNEDDRHQLKAYYYTPTIPTEDLLSVSLTFDYQTATRGWLGLGTKKWGEVKTQAILLEKDAQNLSNHVPQWTYDLYYTSILSITAGTILTLIPGTQPIGIGLLIAGSGLAGAAALGQLSAAYTGNVNDIERVYPDTDFKAELDLNYSYLAGMPINMDAEKNGLYKLNLGSFTGPGVVDVRPIQDTYKYAEITFITRGTVYTLTTDEIESGVIVTKPGVTPGETPPGWGDNEDDRGVLDLIIDFLTNLFKNVGVWIAAGLLVYIAFKWDVFRNAKTTIIYIAIAIIALILLGLL